MVQQRLRPWVMPLAIAVLAFGYVGLSYNRLVRSNQSVDAAWSQVENVYQRRMDLVPNLVSTVKGAAQFERGTLEAVTAQRAQVAAATAPGAAVSQSPELLARYQQAQEGMGQALTRFFAVAEAYPQLSATANFRDLQVQLEGTENRIAVERRNFNQAALEYNALIRTFPRNVIARLFGFDARPYFQASVGADQAPKVDFSSSQ